MADAAAEVVMDVILAIPDVDMDIEIELDIVGEQRKSFRDISQAWK